MAKDILFIGATHGDEKIGVDVVQKIQKRERYKERFDFIIGNPRAYKENKRFTQYDLNRAAPGNLSDALYEKRRAAELIEKSKSYKYTIDLHGSTTGCGVYIIVTNPTPENLLLASLFNISRIVILPSVIPDLVDPVSKYMSCGIEIESGPQNLPETRNALEDVLQDFLNHYKERQEKSLFENMQGKEVYEVYGVLHALPKDATLRPEEFKLFNVGGEDFYALFVDAYTYCTCLKMRKKPFDQLF